MNYLNENAGKMIYRALKRNSDHFKYFNQYLAKHKFQKFYFPQQQIKLFLLILDKTLQIIKSNVYIKSIDDI